MADHVSIVVLTHNRSSVLNRCIRTAVEHSSIAARARWIVLDDSSRELTLQNASLLSRWTRAGLDLVHLSADVRKECSRLLTAADDRGAVVSLLAKAGPRDVSGLRNWGLLAALAVGSAFVFLLDDDMQVGDRRGSFLDSALARYRGRENVIVGGRFHGILDGTHLSRLVHFLRRNRPPWTTARGASLSARLWYSTANPIWVCDDSDSSMPVEAEHARGGLMAFPLGTDCLLPFPTGYDEDSNWCLLRAVLRGTAIYRMGPSARHLPPPMCQPSAAEIRSQLFGGVLFACLLMTRRRRLRRPTIRRIGEAMVREAARVAESFELGLLFEARSELRRFALGTHVAAESRWARSYCGVVTELSHALQETDLRELVGRWMVAFERRNQAFAAIVRNGDAMSSLGHVLRSRRPGSRPGC